MHLLTIVKDLLPYPQPMFRAFIITILLWIMASPAMAENRYASIIVDADTLEVLHAREIDESRYPASLTKVMTLYLTFEALDQGRLRTDQKLTVSHNAARTPPVKMGLRAGQKVSVDTLIQAVAVRSSNDAAVVLAEHLAGSEAAFAELMNAKARALGMQRTTFKTANGLPHPEQKTTARDMAKLASAALSDFRHHYHYFGQTEFRGRKNTNRLLRTRADVDGFKTGYTRASGYNLMVSSKRDGRRIIAIVLGGASNDSRNQHMSDLIDRGFDVISQQAPSVKINPTYVSASTTLPSIMGLRGQQATMALSAQTNTNGWSVKIKGFPSPDIAHQAAQRLQRAAGSGQIDPRSGFSAGEPVYHARVSQLSAQAARQACQDPNLALEFGARRCLIIAP